MKSVYIIAEAGVNHNGDIQMAERLIDIAGNAGANAVKFQTFLAEKLVTSRADKAEYQKRLTDKDESQFDMIKQLELSEDDHFELIHYCKSKSIQFLSSGFDLDSLHFLNKLDLPFLKIPSGEITNLPYLRTIGSFNKPIILSTGMSTLKEVGDAISILEKAGTLKELITVLHCNTEYPTPFEDVNLRAMLTIQDSFNVKVGYSDHTSGIEVSFAAVALGAEVIEKHFTLDKNLSGPDHRASLEPAELKELVKGIRNIEKSLGNGKKSPSSSELKNISIVRKSIVAAKIIEKGEIFSEKNITIKRPATGISPFRWDEVIGIRAEKEYQKDDMIEL